MQSNAPNWQKRFRASIVYASAIATHDSTRGLVTTNPGGVFQLYAWDIPTGNLRRLTDAPQGMLLGGKISPDGEHVYYHSDEAGNELGHWVRIPFEGGPPESISADLPPYASWWIDISADGSQIGFVAAGANGFDAYVVDVSAIGSLGTPRSIHSSQGLVMGPVLSADGRLAAIHTLERATTGLDFNVVVLDTLTGEPFAELWDGERASTIAVRFSRVPGDDRVLATSTSTGMKRPLIWNPRTGDRHDLPLDNLEGEVSPLDWSSDGLRALFVEVSHARQRLYVYDFERDDMRPLDHPSGTWGAAIGPLAYFGPDGEIVAHHQDATHPEELVALDSAGYIARTVLPSGPVPESRAWESITFTSEGVDIQGWLCTPEGEGPFPTILHTHGGPTSAVTEIFDPGCQAFVDEGFAFCTINYRGSTTFGRDFQEAITGDPGRREVADMIAARKWLIDKRIAVPDQVFLAGRSYGGYLTLMALGHAPDLWAGGMAGVPITDWKMLYEDSAKTLSAYAAALLKGTPQERAEQYAASSPLTLVDRVVAPVLILFGRNDTRCPVRPVEEYIRRLKDAGKLVEVYEFQAGHVGSSADVEEGIRQQQVMLEFARSSIRGRS